MQVIGITGGVGAGKTQVLDIINEITNCRIIRADELAKKLECRGNVCYSPIVELLGNDILDEEEQIIPAKMAARIFEDQELLDKVNEIIHPAVKQKILDYIKYEEERGMIDFFFIEAALLIEDGYDLICDELWYVYASEDTRRKRLKSSRGYSDEKIDSIMASQLDEATFRRYCSAVIDNDKDLDNTRSCINDILGEEKDSGR